MRGDGNSSCAVLMRKVRLDAVVMVVAWMAEHNTPTRSHLDFINGAGICRPMYISSSVAIHRSVIVSRSIPFRRQGEQQIGWLRAGSVLDNHLR